MTLGYFKVGDIVRRKQANPYLDIEEGDMGQVLAVIHTKLRVYWFRVGHDAMVEASKQEVVKDD